MTIIIKIIMMMMIILLCVYYYTYIIIIQFARSCNLFHVIYLSAGYDCRHYNKPSA